MEETSTFKAEMMNAYPRALDFNNPAISGFARALDLAFKEDSGQDITRELEKIPRNLAYRIPEGLGLDNEGETKPLRELLLSTGVAGTAFIQTQYANAVLEGAKLQRCARGMLFHENMSAGNTLRLPIFGAYTGRAPEVAEGAEYPDSNGTPTYRDFTIKKYGEKSPITQELIDDSLYNTIALAAGQLGARVENSLNYEAIGVVLENSGKEHDCTGSNLGAKAVSAAMLTLEGKDDGTGGFTADSILMANEFNAGIRNEVVLTEYPGAEGVIRTNAQPYLFGLRQGYTNSTTSSTTYTWGYSADGEIGALVYNMASAGGYVMRDDISIENFRDPLKDLTNVRTKIRFGVNYGIANATCRIKY